MHNAAALAVPRPLSQGWPSQKGMNVGSSDDIHSDTTGFMSLLALPPKGVASYL